MVGLRGHESHEVVRAPQNIQKPMISCGWWDRPVGQKTIRRKTQATSSKSERLFFFKSGAPPGQKMESRMSMLISKAKLLKLLGWRSWLGALASGRQTTGSCYHLLLPSGFSVCQSAPGLFGSVPAFLGGSSTHFAQQGHRPETQSVRALLATSVSTSDQGMMKDVERSFIGTSNKNVCHTVITRSLSRP